MRRGGIDDKVRRSQRGPAKASVSGDRALAEFDCCDLEVEAALREADLALAEAEMITVSQRNRKRIFDLTEASVTPPGNPPLAAEELPLLL